MQYYGTHHFVSLQAAHRYYAMYDEGWEAVARKIESKEIAIGPPAAKPGERVIIIDSGMRYAIVEAT